MTTEEKTKRKPKRRPKQSSMHMTIWSMNGEPIPQEVVKQLEGQLLGVIKESEVRLLSNVVRF